MTEKEKQELEEYIKTTKKESVVNEKTGAESLVNYFPVYDNLIIQLPKIMEKTKAGVFLPRTIAGTPQVARIIGKGGKCEEFEIGQIVHIQIYEQLNPNEKPSKYYMEVELDDVKYGIVSKLQIKGIYTGTQKDELFYRHFVVQGEHHKSLKDLIEKKKK